MLKWLLGIGLIALIGIGAAGYYLFANLDALVARAIEQYGSEAAGVSVRVDRVELDLEAGRASIYDLRVANPPGFEGAEAFSLGEITVDIDLESLREQNPIVLDEIRIEAPAVFYELMASGVSNLDVIKKNASSGGGGNTDEGADSAPGPRLRIRKLRFAEGHVEADTRAIGGNELEATLGTAELKDVGGSKGATGAEIGAVVVKEIGRQTAIAIARSEAGALLKDHIGEEGAKAVEGLLNRFGL